MFDKCPQCGYHDAIIAQLNLHVMNKFKNQFGAVAVFNKADNVDTFSVTDPKTNQLLTWTKVVESNNSNIKVMDQPKLASEIPLPPKPAAPVKEAIFEDDGAAPVDIVPKPAVSPIVANFGGQPTASQPASQPATPINPTTKFNP